MEKCATEISAINVFALCPGSEHWKRDVQVSHDSIARTNLLLKVSLVYDSVSMGDLVNRGSGLRRPQF